MLGCAVEQNDTPSVGDQIHGVLRRKRMSQNELARRSGLSPSYVSKILRNKVRDPRTTLPKIEKALEVKRGYFKVPARPAADAVAIMQEALDNQRQMRDDLEAVSAQIARVARTVQKGFARAQEDLKEIEAALRTLQQHSTPQPSRAQQRRR